MNISNNFMKKLKLILITAIIVYIISIVVIYFEAKKKRTQKDTKKSLQEGFGSYGDEESLGCESGDGKCSSKGTETIVQYCRPHPNTKKGCIDENGNQTYSTIIKKRQCNTQCVASKFTVESGVRVGNPEKSYLGTSIKPRIVSVGCDNIIDKRFGLDVTSDFLGKFNKTVFKYPLKSCIPSGKDSIFQGYYQRVSSCLPSDGKGSNNCRIVCGRDRNILNLTGFANAKLNKKLLSYFPTEENEEGVVRNVCYDINNKDQIQILNYPGSVPKDFIYPNRCYKHTNVLDFPENIWPVSGTSNIFSLTNSQVAVDTPYIDLIGPQVTQFQQYVANPGNVKSIIRGDYDLNNNQDSYVKVRIGSNISILEKIYPSTNTGLDINRGVSGFLSSGNVRNDIFYLSLSTTDLTIDLLQYCRTTGPVLTQNPALFNPNQIILSPNVDASITDFNDYIFSDGVRVYYPCSVKESMSNLFEVVRFNSSYLTPYIQLSTIVLPGVTLPTGTFSFYVVLQNKITKENLNLIRECTVTNSTQATHIGGFGDLLLPNGNASSGNWELKFLFKCKLGLRPGSSLAGYLDNSSASNPGGSKITINFEQSFFTGTTLINKLEDSPATYNHLNIRKNISTLPGAQNGINPGSSIPYCIFATSPHNNLKGYHFPLYLTQQKSNDITVTFMEFPKVTFRAPNGTCYKGSPSNFYFRPEYYGNQQLLLFNEEILTSTVQYRNNYFFPNNDNTPKYFISDISTVNVGRDYEPSTIYRLSADKITKDYQLIDTGVANNQSVISGIENGTSLAVAVICSSAMAQPVQTVKIIRGDSAFVTGSVASAVDTTANQKKVKNYFQMIQYQGFITDTEVQMIFEPERHLSVVADFDVFKSPYTINSNNQKNFLCYDSSGRARPEGYITEITTKNSQVFTNIACPSKTVKYEVIGGDPLCAVKGIENSTINDVLEICTQDRDSKPIQFINKTGSTINQNNCIVSPNSSEYETINNQLGFGLQLFPIQKASTFAGLSANTGDKINNDLNAYASYFTKKYETGKIYGPGEEFYLEKTRNNYFVSLSNDNNNFVEDVSTWTRVFIFENNTVVRSFQYFFDVHPPRYVPNQINYSLGKDGKTYQNLLTTTGSDLNTTFFTVTPGVNSQNYLNQGVTYFWGGIRRRTNAEPKVHINNNPTLPFDNNKWRVAFFENYIRQLEECSYRADYSLGDQMFIKVKPGQGGDYSKTPTSSPIFNTFDMILDDNGEYFFTSKFYDSNIQIPWASDVEPGDIFNPDFTYFNMFFYTFILSNGYNFSFPPGEILPYDIPSYANISTSSDGKVKTAYSALPVLKQYFLLNTETTNPPASFNENFSTNHSLLINDNTRSKGFNLPEVSDYIVQIPISPGSIKDGTVISGMVDFTKSNLSKNYPTLAIKRINNIIKNDPGNASGIELQFDEKDYSGVKEFNEPKSGSFYYFNLGNATGLNNLITRCFTVDDIFTKQLKADSNNFYDREETLQTYRVNDAFITDQDLGWYDGYLQFAWNQLSSEGDNSGPISIQVINKKGEKKYASARNAGIIKPASDSPKDWQLNFPISNMDSHISNGIIRYLVGNGAGNSNATMPTGIVYTSLTVNVEPIFYANKANKPAWTELISVWDGTKMTSKTQSTVLHIYPASITLNPAKVNLKTYTKTGIEFKFSINSINQEVMTEIYKTYTKANQTPYGANPPAPVPEITVDTKFYKQPTCLNNIAYTEDSWNAAYPNGPPSDPAPGVVACFTVGCMAGNPDTKNDTSVYRLETAESKDSEVVMWAACARDLGGGTGHTTFWNANPPCPGPKYWYCPESPEAYNKKITALLEKQAINNGGNFLTPALSARYIKKSFTSPFISVPGNNSYAALYNSSPEDSLNIKVMSQCTEIAFNLQNKNHFYFNEFREQANYFSKQIDRVFSVGDTFEYNFSVNSRNIILSGNKEFIKIATFRVVKVGVTVTNPDKGFKNGAPLSDPPTLPLNLDYDYECSVVGDTNPVTLYNTYFNPPAKQADSGPNYSIGLGLNFLYIPYDNLDSGDTVPKPDFWRYSLPYTLSSGDSGGSRVFLNGYSGGSSGTSIVFNFNDTCKSNPLIFTGQTKSRIPTELPTGTPKAPNNYTVRDYLKEVITGGPYDERSEVTEPFYHDAYKLTSLSSGLSMYSATLPFQSAIYSGSAIRAGILDTMVLTGTEMQTETGQKAYVNVEVVGKPYGCGFFVSSPNTENTMINYEAFGKIKSFSFSNQPSFPINTILRSKKGFKIKFLSIPPPAYQFLTLESPSGEILPYQNGINYTKDEIVNIKDRNLKNYFRNITTVALPYQKTINIKDPNIPFAIYDEKRNTWFYPVYKSYVQGTKPFAVGSNTVYVKDVLFSLRNTKNPTKKISNRTKYLSYDTQQSILKIALSNFKNVPETVYPEDNFTDYDPKSIYDTGNVVKSPDGKLYKSLKNLNTSPLFDISSWEIDDLTQKMTSTTGDKFYTIYKQDTDFLDVIDSVKNLDNQNFPALVKYNFNNSGFQCDTTTGEIINSNTPESNNQYEFCPKPCTYYDLKETYENTLLDSAYFDPIRYLFKTPVMLRKNSSDLFVTLGNTPVEKSQNYNVGFLQDGGAKRDFLSQYLYFVNIKDQEDKYNRPLCTGGLSITTSTGLCPTEANKFEFANSLLFNFLPCNINSQDFINYNVDVGMSTGTSILVTSENAITKNSPNIFPPYGVSCNVLVTSKTSTGMSFRKVSGHFEYTYPILSVNYRTTNTITKGTSSVTLSGIVQKEFINIPKTAQNVSYGDGWYIPSEDGMSIREPFGFIIPRSDGGISTSSFIQLNNSSEYNNTDKINLLNNNQITGANVSLKTVDFTLSTEPSDPNRATKSGTYTNQGTSYYLEFLNTGTVLQRGEAVFYPENGEIITKAENIYLPTYDIAKNIKVHAVGIFGESFVGDLGYTLDKENSNYSLDGNQKSTMLFNEFRNDLFLTDVDKHKKEVFIGNDTVNLDNVYKTFIINFNDDKTFSIKPNLYKRPISSPTNEFLYRGGTSSVNAGSCIAAINSESTTVLISEEMSGLTGVSVNISLEDFLEYKTKYTKTGSSIPGKTNVQIQLQEIRENRTSTYIEDDNKCSIYFEPLVGTKPGKLSTAKWEMTMSSRSMTMYDSKIANPSPRFTSKNGKFVNSEIEINLKGTTNIYLGCNLYYLFDQKDSTNSAPVVFSTTKNFNESFPSDYPDNFDKEIYPGQKFKIQYLINNEAVSYKTYTEKFSDKVNTKSRAVEIFYQGAFGLSVPDYSNAKIYYGTAAGGVNTGGMIKFEYH